MHDEIKVTVVKYPDRDNYVLRYIDPDSGRQKTKSAKTTKHGEALKAAARWEAELRSGKRAPGKISWAEFRDRHENEVQVRMAHSTCRKFNTLFDLVERFAKPVLLRDLNTDRLSTWMNDIQEGRAQMTAAIYCRQLKSALHWARDMGFIPEVPKMRIPKNTSGKMMKGRPIVLEEHERLLLAAEKVIPAEHVATWQRFLCGLWWSGLRLGEALGLSWDSAADVAVVHGGARLMLRFKAAGQKARRDELWPCPPEFAELLEATPEAERVGPVFRLRFGKAFPTMAQDRVMRLITTIAKQAKVIVDEKTRKPATAHDYRRAFGTRWAKRVMPATLKRLMRHQDINTTMKFYVQTEVDQIADEMWAAMPKPEGNNSGNTPAETPVETGDSQG